jgi:uncharacterized membrane-anchored protein
VASSPSNSVTQVLNKVPEVTIAFWIMKLMFSTVGETGADYLAVHVGLGIAMTGGIMVSRARSRASRSPRPDRLGELGGRGTISAR